MNNNLVIISGATGMSGSETVKQLLNKGYYIIGFDNFFASSINSIKGVLDHPHLYFFEFDLINQVHMNELSNIILEKKNQLNISEIHFINFAAIVHTKYFYNPESSFYVNVLGMKSFLDLSIKLNAVSFINCSTSEVYSMNSYKIGGVKESDDLKLVTAEKSLRTSYATGKLITEFFLKDVVDKKLIQGCSIRFANVYSNDELYAEHIIPYIISSFQKGNVVTLLENSKETMRSFLHNYDSCTAVISLLETPAALDGSIYNVGTYEEILITDLVEKISKLMNVFDYKIEYKGVRSADPKRRLLNTDKIRNKTNWIPKVNLNSGLIMCIENRINEI